MTPPPARRRHLASSPFQPDPEPIITQFEVGDLVNHDTHGMGRVSAVETDAVTVKFRAQTLRLTSPYAKMSKL